MILVWEVKKGEGKKNGDAGFKVCPFIERLKGWLTPASTFQSLLTIKAKLPQEVELANLEYQTCFIINNNFKTFSIFIMIKITRITTLYNFD